MSAFVPRLRGAINEKDMPAFNSARLKNTVSPSEGTAARRVFTD
jgi:hypothetical protein